AIVRYNNSRVFITLCQLIASNSAKIRRKNHPILIALKTIRKILYIRMTITAIVISDILDKFWFYISWIVPICQHINIYLLRKNINLQINSKIFSSYLFRNFLGK